MYNDYIVAIAPLVIAHIILPPLSYYEIIPEKMSPEIQQLFDMMYSFLPERFLSERFVESLLFDDEQKHMVTYLTHIFIHGSYSHMFNNLVGTILFGLPVYNEYSTFGLYFVFLSGGIFAAMPSFLKIDQQKEVSRLIASQVTISNDSTGSSYLPKKFKYYWNKIANDSATTLVALYHPKKSCGSSGAVCALMGCQMVLLLRDSILTIVRVSKSFKSRFQNKNKTSSTIKNGFITYCCRDQGEPKTRNTDYTTSFITSNQLLTLTRNFISIAQSIIYLNLELKSIYSDSSGGSVLHKTDIIGNSNNNNSGNVLVRAMELFQVSHGAHIQGLTFGVAFASLFGIILPSYQRFRIKQNRSTEY